MEWSKLETHEGQRWTAKLMGSAMHRRGWQDGEGRRMAWADQLSDDACNLTAVTAIQTDAQPHQPASVAERAAKTPLVADAADRTVLPWPSMRIIATDGRRRATTAMAQH
jgi:hypothetical protein